MRRLLILLSFCALCFHATAHDKETLKLISYNIRYINAPGDVGDFAWDARKASSIRMIQSQQPDVIGIQEAKQPQIQYLVEQLPDYAHTEMGRDYGVKADGGEHMLIFWKRNKYELLDSGHYWLSETPDSASFGWDAACRRITVWVCLRDKETKKKFYYFDTHLDHKGSEARIQGATLNVKMMRKIAGKRNPAFISGDMNGELGTSTECFVKPYLDWLKSARSEAASSDNKPTYHGFGKVKPLRIDYILYRNANPCHYETLDSTEYGVKYLSDHYPIVCTFQL